jgi:hydrogenase-4 component B
MTLFLSGIGLYLIGGLIQAVKPRGLKGQFFAFFSAPAALLVMIPSFQVLISGLTIQSTFQFPFPLEEVPLVLDGLAAFFAIIIASMGFAATVYSTGYLKPYAKKGRTVGAHYLQMSLLMSFMLLVTVIQNALAFLIAWEIMSLSSFFLVAFENEKKEVFDAALHYLVAMHVGVVFLISAFILLSIKSGGLVFSGFTVIFKNDPHLASLLFIFFFIGFGTKAGFFPFHVWLPKAHPAAPGHISGIMSAVMIKTGIYGILRILTLMETPPRGVGYFVLSISLVSAVLGILYAMAQRDTKRFLAYSSIENIGIMGMGMGIGMLGLSYGNPGMTLLGFGGCLIHLLNHSIVKSLLFFSAGAVYHGTHERNMEKMGGLIHRMPYTALFSMIGSAAVCGLPPLNGFIGKFLLYLGMIKGVQASNPLLNAVGILGLAGLAFVGAAAILAFSKMVGIVFLGTPRENLIIREKESFPMLLPMGLLAVIALLIGLFPYSVFILVEKPLLALSGSGITSDVLPLSLTGKISLAFALFIGMTIGLFFLRRFLLKGRTVSKAVTWGCGYTAPNPRMQYSASSFARTFMLLYKPLTRMTFSIEEPESIFPRKGKLETHIPDIVEKYIIKPVLRGIDGFVKLFNRVQGGATQQYILYGLLFLVAAILWVLGS